MEHASSPSDEDRDEDGGLTQMSSLCPLWDNMLPLDAAMLKSKQVSSVSCLVLIFLRSTIIFQSQLGIYVGLCTNL